MGNIEKDLRGEGGFLSMSWKINFLFSSHLAISCAHHKFHYFEGPKPLNHALDIWSMMKMPRDVLYNGFVAVVRRIKLE